MNKFITKSRDQSRAATVRKRDARNAFTTDQLNVIFQAPIYTGCVDDERNYGKPGVNRPKRGRFWLPILSLFHGLRLPWRSEARLGQETGRRN